MIKILFVCMGNICRSPSAEAVMNKLIKREGLGNQIKCDSAGTIAYHEGEPSDARMKRHALNRGYKLISISRRILEDDLEEFNYIVAMDRENFGDLSAIDRYGRFASKIHLIPDFSTNGKYDEVPDPYYGGPEGFEKVLDILEDSCKGLLEKIKNELN